MVRLNFGLSALLNIFPLKLKTSKYIYMPQWMVVWFYVLISLSWHLLFTFSCSFSQTPCLFPLPFLSFPVPSLSFPLSCFLERSAVLLDKGEAVFLQLFQQEKQKAVREQRTVDSMVLDLEFGLRVVQWVEEGSSFSLPVNEKKNTISQEQQ